MVLAHFKIERCLLREFVSNLFSLFLFAEKVLKRVTRTFSPWVLSSFLSYAHFSQAFDTLRPTKIALTKVSKDSQVAKCSSQFSSNLTY